ncbi:WcaF family extracellular polysaccharide biosynthesis acetyltransferase [Flavihumibacter sediminis]|nr:WcaF family extracellular polysaccharide biosynthesis acetyltransferase [Flavihumibacter sediminis]
MKVDLSSYNNNWYKKQIGASAFKQILWYYINVIFFRSGLFPFSPVKVLLLRTFGSVIGKDVNIKPYVNIKYPWKLIIGDYCWIGENVWIDNLANIKIGNHVCISQGAYLLTGNHSFSKSSFDLMVQGIILDDGVWIGAQSLVCPGITCFSHSVLTARSVATKDLEAYTIYQGNPALAIKERVINP